MRPQYWRVWQSSRQRRLLGTEVPEHRRVLVEAAIAPHPKPGIRPTGQRRVGNSVSAEDMQLLIWTAVEPLRSSVLSERVGAHQIIGRNRLIPAVPLFSELN